MISKKYARIKTWHAIRRTIITAIVLGIITFIIAVAPDYIKDEQTGLTKLIINNNNVTANVKSEIKIIDGEIYLSTEDVKNFFDEYITIEVNNIITTSNTKTVAIPKTGNTIWENGSTTNIKNTVITEDGKYYLPMNELASVYNYEIKYIDSSKTIVVDSLNKKLVQAISSKNTNVKYKATIFSKDVDKVKRGDTLTIIQDTKTDTDFTIKDWIRVRTENGKIGYIKKSNIINEKNVRENLEDQRINGKISIVWDYYTSASNAPTRIDKISGINVVSPSLFEVNNNGTIDSNIGTSGKNYINWAHSNNYKVWPTLSNSALNDLDAVSNMLGSFENRSKLIDSIINNLISSSVDGINIDFENMHKSDKENYSRFIIELAPRLQEIGMMMCVDVTAPDGSDTWSLCYDRNLIGKVSDYMVFIAYDQHGMQTANSISGATWIENNINKFLGQEGVPANKLIVSVPFYTRLWKEQNGIVTNKVVNMNKITIPSGVEKTWDDATKQYYIEYTSDGATYKMWIEDTESISAKLDLINKYKLTGAGFWEKDRETSDVWEIVKDKLGINN